MRCLIITSNDALDLELDNDWKLAAWYLWAQIETNRSFPDFSSVLDFISKSMCVASTRVYGAAWAFYWTFAPHGSCVSCRHYVWKLQEPSERRHVFTKWILALLSDWSKMNFESIVHHFQYKRSLLETNRHNTLGYPWIFINMSSVLKWVASAQYILCHYRPLFKSCSNNLKYQVSISPSKSAKATGTAKSIRIAHEFTVDWVDSSIVDCLKHVEALEKGRPCCSWKR